MSKQLRKIMLEKQDNKCAICLKGDYCAPCNDGKIHETCKIQPINTFDHNHTHINCKGCELCFRGMVHPICNRMVAYMERNPHLCNNTMIEYINRGKMGDVAISPYEPSCGNMSRWSSIGAKKVSTTRIVNPKIAPKIKLKAHA
jgi:hypothetical protein